MERAFGTELWIVTSIAGVLWVVSVMLAGKWANHITRKVDALLENSSTHGSRIATLEERTQGHERDIAEVRHEIGTVHRRVDGLAAEVGKR